MLRVLRQKDLITYLTKFQLDLTGKVQDLGNDEQDS